MKRALVEMPDRPVGDAATLWTEIDRLARALQRRARATRRVRRRSSGNCCGTVKNVPIIQLMIPSGTSLRRNPLRKKRQFEGRERPEEQIKSR